MVAFLSGILAVSLLIFSLGAFAKTFGEKLCKTDPQLQCYTVKSNESLKKLFINPQDRDLVMRINRTNKIYPGMKIAIPRHENMSMMDFAPFATQIDPPGEKLIYVSLRELAFGAYDETGTLQYWGPISGGKGWCPDIQRGCHTATGKFAISAIQGPECVSSKFPVGEGGAPMPYCMFFYGGYALHGSYDVPGYHASHGCVRLFINDARWLNEEFVMGELGIPVIVDGDDVDDGYDDDGYY
jgi:L,D-transpeptidase ErfK/SrfK